MNFSVSKQQQICDFFADLSQLITALPKITCNSQLDPIQLQIDTRLTAESFCLIAFLLNF